MAKELAAGDKAPEFDLADDAGGRLRLSALRGETVVLYFYPQDDTETCTVEAVAFSGLAAEFQKAGAIVIGVSPDSVASHQRFRRKHGLKVALGADDNRAVVDAYGVWRQKTLFGRTYMGVERTTFLIDPAGKIVRVWRKVRTPGHADAVLAAVEALAAPASAKRPRRA
jgi:thioredoxin-dependent peroxiredoxin